MKMTAHIMSYNLPEWTLCEIPRRTTYAADDESEPCELCFEMAKENPDPNVIGRMLVMRARHRIKLRSGKQIVMK